MTEHDDAECHSWYGCLCWCAGCVDHESTADRAAKRLLKAAGVAPTNSALAAARKVLDDLPVTQDRAA